MFNRIYNNNKIINKELKTLRSNKNVIGRKSQGYSFKNSEDISTGKILNKRIRNRPSYINKNYK